KRLGPEAVDGLAAAIAGTVRPDAELVEVFADRRQAARFIDGLLKGWLKSTRALLPKKILTLINGVSSHPIAEYDRLAQIRSEVSALPPQILSDGDLRTLHDIFEFGLDRLLHSIAVRTQKPVVARVVDL